MYGVRHAIAQAIKENPGISGIKMIIFKSLLTTFEVRVIFRGNWDSIKYWTEPKTLAVHISKFSQVKRACSNT